MKKKILEAIAIAFGALGFIIMLLNAFIMDKYTWIAMAICMIICAISWQASFIFMDRD